MESALIELRLQMKEMWLRCPLLLLPVCCPRSRPPRLTMSQWKGGERGLDLCQQRVVRPEERMNEREEASKSLGIGLCH